MAYEYENKTISSYDDADWKYEKECEAHASELREAERDTKQVLRGLIESATYLLADIENLTLEESLALDVWGTEFSDDLINLEMTLKEAIKKWERL